MLSSGRGEGPRVLNTFKAIIYAGIYPGIYVDIIMAALEASNTIVKYTRITNTKVYINLPITFMVRIEDKPVVGIWFPEC